MADPDEPLYNYAATNNTRAAAQAQSQAAKKRKKKNNVLPSIPADLPAENQRKHKHKKFVSHLADQDTYPVAQTSAGPTRSRTDTPATSHSALSGTRSRADSDDSMSGGTGSMFVPPAAGSSRFAGAIGKDTELTQGLEDDQVVNLYGIPVDPTRNTAEEEILANEPARNVCHPRSTYFYSYSQICRQTLRL